MEAIRRILHTEIRNRLDAVSSSPSLDRSTIERVVDKLIVAVEMQLRSEGVPITLDDVGFDGSAEKGYTPRWGERTMGGSFKESSGPWPRS